MAFAGRDSTTPVLIRLLWVLVVVAASVSLVYELPSLDAAHGGGAPCADAEAESSCDGHDCEHDREEMHCSDAVTVPPPAAQRFSSTTSSLHAQWIPGGPLKPPRGLRA